MPLYETHSERENNILEYQISVIFEEIFYK